ncbi:DUF2332 domain-containing protein [Qipengyuania sp. 1NDH17]|uniref:DUF2332 domain-containing protein n=1 Tax=Qipengyuania polymorpha TaxID=2867234 RepID=A0ABS7ITU2_9SPHN|nr:DUF2332 domain-containing protein [Qipengyuania polymorpha]MBX7456771.1 DUF2332 domain-containing protein [Qipengyuania polymorpha]
MAGGAVMDIVSVPEAIEWQAKHAENAGAPGTAQVIRALLALEDSEAATARRIFAWQGLSLRDAMPLRIAGGLHNLLLTGEEPRLEDVYAGRMPDQGQVDTLVREIIETHDFQLMPWLDGPPQTNEAGRSASFAAGLLWLADGRTTAQFEWLEIGASAGINTMLGRYHYDLGGVKTGPGGSRMRIAPEWRGGPPPASEIGFVDARGSDIAPVDLTDEAQALRLKSYVWPEATGRMARIDAAIELAKMMSPEVERMDAWEWVFQELSKTQEQGVTRVLAHSIMWQYLTDDAQHRIKGAIQTVGSEATPERPFAHISLETNRETFAHELKVRYWPGGEDEVHLANAHPHGAWVEWLSG